MSVIEIKNLTRDYGGGKGIFDLSFSVESGEVFGFLGPNGAGKTTAIRHIMGFIRAESGSCTVNGSDCFTDSDKIQKTLGYIPGELLLFDDMKGSGFLKFVADYRGLKDLSRMKELSERFDLDARIPLKKMSKGTKQKVGIVAALMHDPDVLVLDEPTSGLDPLMQSRFIGLITEERKRGKTIIISSHIFEEVERTCHRVGIIRAGRLVVTDTIENLKAAQTKKYYITFESAEAAKRFESENFDTMPQTETTVEVSLTSGTKELIAALSKYPVTNLSAPSLSLEEVFMQYYGDGKNV